MPRVRTELIAGLARASGAAGMAGGQCLDLEADKLGTPARPDLAHIERLQAMKTGALIRYACEAGAILGRADASQRRALAQFGERLGAAFQIADDLLDVEGEAGVMGKATGKDARKATLVSLLGVPAARARLGLLEAQAIAAAGAVRRRCRHPARGGALRGAAAGVASAGVRRETPRQSTAYHHDVFPASSRARGCMVWADVKADEVTWTCLRTRKTAKGGGLATIRQPLSAASKAKSPASSVRTTRAGCASCM